MILEERYTLSTERIGEIADEFMPEIPFKEYFKDTAAFMTLIKMVIGLSEDNELCKLDEKAAKNLNQELYKDILPENYDTSYLNPGFMHEMAINNGVDPKIGQYLCFLSAELKGLIPYAFEGKKEIVTIYQELFIEIYNMITYSFMDGETPDPEEIRDVLYWFERDNLEIILKDRITDTLSPERSFIRDKIMSSDLTSTRYLYDFGEYITDNELKTAEFLNTFSSEEIEAMASTYTEGYRIGFIKASKPLDKKTTVDIRYCLGFERIVREAVKQFEKMGLQPILYRAASLAVVKKSLNRIGCYGAIPNRQFDYDHREDNALFLDSEYIQRRLDLMKNIYEENKELAYGYAGPAVMEVFGEDPFAPKACEHAMKLSDRQRKLSVELSDKSGRLVNEYINREERSFTIIAYPLPEIGKDYEAIFKDTVKINTLDQGKYEKMQQKMIDVLDRADRVHVAGKREAGNVTELTVELCKLNDPLHETKFENCVADVNIPVGEVFTSPVLKGTNGCLHVTEVYLNGLKYKDLHVYFKDGMVSDYSCKNFEGEEENRRFIEDNLLFHHKSLPMGEFAIGTNTTAYRMSRDYDIGGRLPILIGEKTGPHFAIGDTCYSHEEEVRVYNPDKKEIIARSNECSDKRKTKPEEAYFYCHTDITIPYSELGLIEAIHPDGSITEIIKDGLFVLEGLSELNEPLLSDNC
ncbi:MAG: aminopeptidase [Lachnospiraceae bacterium]|nr:aminopeptidase [Lachnospiraceae bacterium]